MKWLSRMRTVARGFKDLAAPIRKLMIALIGGAVVLIGIAMIVLPGPAFIVFRRVSLSSRPNLPGQGAPVGGRAR
jgi:hypothetical protein